MKKLKANITNLRSVASGKEELDNIDLNIKTYVPIERLVSSAERISDIVLDDGLLVNPVTRKILTDIYIAILFTDYDGRTLSNDLDVDNLLEVHKVIEETNLLNKVYQINPYGINSFLQLIEDTCEKNKISYDTIIDFANLASEITQIDKLTEDINELLDSDAIRMIEDDTKETREKILNTGE